MRARGEAREGISAINVGCVGDASRSHCDALKANSTEGDAPGDGVEGYGAESGEGAVGPHHASPELTIGAGWSEVVGGAGEDRLRGIEPRAAG